MTEKEIKENLCYYDLRNPDCIYDEEEVLEHKKHLSKEGKTCSCDNCFYGRSSMAEELLKYIFKTEKEEINI